MQKVKNEKVNSISDILEEIVRCVTAPSFCVMPWKCVTMAVGNRTDPLVKKSVVHIYRTCFDGQNIFQIKVHNCKKEICDHAICTKECETTRQTNTQAGKEAMQYEVNKRKRKKRNKYADVNKETMLSCHMMSETADEFHKNFNLKERKDIKYPSSQKNKRITKKSENKEKPSCTLQIFSDGKTRKLNFQLHPAMKVFLGKALDRIEGQDTKPRRTNSPSYRANSLPDVNEELLAKTIDGFKSKTMKKSSTHSQYGNKNKRTESVEEFEINLPDNTSHAKDDLDIGQRRSLSEISIDMSKRVCHWDVNQIHDNMEKNEACSEFEMNAGYLMNDIYRLPVRQSHNEKGKSNRKTEFRLGRTREKCHNKQLTEDNTHLKTTTAPLSDPYHERGMKYNYNEGILMGDEERFHHHLKFQDHRAKNFNSKYLVKSNLKQNPTDFSRNISSRSGNNPQPYTNSSQYFQNRTTENIIRTPYIVDYQNDNNELLVNDIRNINNGNYSISDNRASMYSTDYINTPPIYRSNARIFPPPVAHEPFPMTTGYGTILMNDGVYSNGFYGNRQYHNFSNHGRECLNVRVAPPQHYEIPNNQRDINFPKEHIDRETQISHDERENLKVCRRLNRYHLTNTRDINGSPESENRMLLKEINKAEHRKDLEDIPTSDRNHNDIKDPIRNVNDLEESIDNDLEDKRTSDFQRHVRTVGTGVAPEIRANHRLNKPIKRKNFKEPEKSNSNSDNRKPGNSTSAEYLPSCSIFIESKTSSNNQDIAKISNIDNNSSGSSGRKENKRFTKIGKKNRKEKSNADKAYLLQNTNKMLQNVDPTAHPNFTLINNPKIQYENEEEHYFEQEDIGEFKHLKPSKISSEEKVMNGQKRNNRKDKTENSNVSQSNAVYRSKASKERHIVIKRTESIETTDSSNYLAEEVYINNASEKSSDILSFCYHFPEDYSNYQFFKANKNRNGREQISREKINDPIEGLCHDDYDTDSKFFCYPSQISWNHYQNLQQLIPNINPQHYLKVQNTRIGKRFEPKKKFATEGESSNLCRACCKALNEDKTAEKSLENSCANKYETNDCCSKHFTMNNSQCKGMTNLGESYCNKNDIIPIKDKRSGNSTNLNLNGVLNSTKRPLTNATTGVNQVYHNNNVEKSVVKSNNLDSNNLKEQNANMKCENLQKKQSKMLHSQSVKKFFSHAKEYLNFRKYSTSSIKSGLNNGVLAVGPLNSIIQSTGAEHRVEDRPCVNRKQSVNASDNKRDSDCFSVNIKQFSNPEATVCSKNNIDVLQSEDIHGMLSSNLKPKEVFINEVIANTYLDTKIYKPQTNTFSQVNLKDEKYRLYGGNELTVDYPSMEDSNLKFIKNEFKILKSESECEGFSDDMYGYSSNDWQSEVAKNWVGTTRKKYNKHNSIVKASLNKRKPKSVYSSGSDFSKCKVEKEEKCEVNNKKPMINATIALSPDKQKEKENKLEVEDRFKLNRYSRQKSDYKFSNLFSNSIKNNYKKIKGLVKRSHTQQKNKSPTRETVLKSSSFTETQSQGFSTSVTSTYNATKSGDTTVGTESSTVERFCNESTINSCLSDSNYAKSDPIIRTIEPGTWQKFVSRKFPLQSAEVSERENIDNSSTSDVSIEESNLLLRLNRRIKQPTGRTDGCRHTPIYSKNQFSENGPTVQRRWSKTYRPNHPVPSQSMDDPSDESVLNQAESSNCFENPMVDPKTGFRPSLPT